MLSLSYGKDSMACIGACEELGWPIDRIITADVWATDTIPADPPEMLEFKARADEIIKSRWGLSVEHIRNGRTYEDIFYRVYRRSRKNNGAIYGFPFSPRGQWCQSELKMEALRKAMAEQRDCIQYIGIASDEPKRHGVLSDTKLSPLVAAGWDQAKCKEWCEANGLLSPIYMNVGRGGCWFCHNQSVSSLRGLRKNHPELWALLLKWDTDSPVTFRADGHTVHDFDRRFRMEDDGLIFPDDKVFRWAMLDSEEMNYRWF